MNILPFGFPMGGALGANAGTTAQLPPSGLGFAVALDGAQAGGMGILDGLVSTPLPAQLSLGTPTPGAAPAGVLPAVPLSQLLTTAARVSAPATAAIEAPAAGEAAATTPDLTLVPAAEPAPSTTAKPAVVADAPAKADAPVADAPLPNVDAPQPATGAAEETPAETKAEANKPAEALPDLAEPAIDASAPPVVTMPIATPVAAPLPQAPAVQREPAGETPTPATRKATAVRTPSSSAAAPADSNIAAPAEGFADAMAKPGSTDGEQGAGADTGQQQALPQDAGKPGAGAPSTAQFQPTPAGEIGRAATAAPAAAAPATHEPEVHAQPGHLGQSLGVEIARKIEAGEETLRVRLNPGELGRVEVTLGFDDRGALQATMRAESAQALDLLRQDVPELARTLDQAGVRTDAQSFRFESRTGDGSGSQNGSQQQRGQQQHSSARQGEFETDDQPYRAIRGDGRVDLLA